MCLPDPLDRLERNCSSCLIFYQLMAGAPSPLLHRQCGILCRKILEVQKQRWDLESFWRHAFLFPPYSSSPFLYWFHWKFIGSVHHFQKCCESWHIALCHALIHGFSENVIDASSSRGETDGNHLYCIVLHVGVTIEWTGELVVNPPPPTPVNSNPGNTLLLRCSSSSAL